MSTEPSYKTVAQASAKNSGETYTTNLHAQDHVLVADEPKAVGGQNLGPSPGELLCMALASCKAITLRMYIQRKKWEIEDISVKVELQKEDLSSAASNRFNCVVTVTGSVTTEQKERLLHIAKACPVSKLLTNANAVNTQVI